VGLPVGARSRGAAGAALNKEGKSEHGRRSRVLSVQGRGRLAGLGDDPSTTLDLYTRRTDDSTRILRAFDDEDPDDGASDALVPA
jgi:hypothetical protein